MDLPTLAAGPVRLRPLHPADVDGLVEPGPAGGRQLVLAVERDGRFAGTVRLGLDGSADMEGAADIGYALLPWARGAGTMSTALRLLLVWAFAELDLDVVRWRAPVGNWPARRVAWACGFTVEGTVRAPRQHAGPRRPVWTGSLLRGEPMTPRTTWWDVPEVHGGSVLLRRHRDADALRVVEACAAPSTQAWLPELPSPYTLVDAATYLCGREEEHATGRGLYWAVADSKDPQRLLGAIGLSGLHSVTGEPSRGAEIGYWTHPDARGRGVAGAAVRLASRHALLPAEDGGLGLPRVLIRAAAGNVASRAVAERAGFRHVGVDRAGERLRDGTVHDFVRYDLLAAELPHTR